MNMNILKLVGGVAVTAMVVSTAVAQPADAGDKVRDFKQKQEELNQAGREMIKKSFSPDTPQNIQKQLDKLTERKTNAERAVQYARGKLNSANKDLAAAEKTSNAAEVAKASKDVSYWTDTLKTAEAELAQVESEMKGAITNFQKSILDPVQSNIVLPGDALQIFVLEDDSFNGIYQVRRGGYIIMPRVGRVSVAGKDLQSAEKTVKESLEATQLRQGTVMIERTRGDVEEESSGVIYLAGEFNTPGPMKIPAGFSPTIVTTILRSGGVTTSADLSKVKLLRLESGKALVEEVNVQGILEGVGLPSDLSLNPGDIVVVPSFTPIVYVTGNVKNPGIQKLFQDEELTAYTAILRSGGFARFANLRKVYVIRDHGNGEKRKIAVNIKDVQAGNVPDVVLRGKDIVVVPESFFSF
jgi:protein involved in polysaccharide export with SLBB domain